MNKFGNYLRKVRNSTSQTKFAEAIGVSQPQLGRWERGDNKPQTADVLDKITAAAKKLKLNLDPTELQAAWNEEGRPKSRSVLLTEAAYLQEQQDFLDTMERNYAVPKSSIRICFLGIDHLPVVGSVDVRNIWIKNLKRQISYALFWFIDYLDPLTIDKLLGALTQICVELEQSGANPEETGKIIHYPLLADRTSASTEKVKANKKHYESVQRQPIQKKWNAFHQIKETLEVPNNLLRYYQTFGSTVCYLSTTASVQP